MGIVFTIATIVSGFIISLFAVSPAYAQPAKPLIRLIELTPYLWPRSEAEPSHLLHNPPEGYSVKEIEDMSNDAILDMAYFLSEGEWNEEQDQQGPEVIIQLMDDDPPAPPDLPF